MRQSTRQERPDTASTLSKPSEDQKTSERKKSASSIEQAVLDQILVKCKEEIQQQMKLAIAKLLYTKREALSQIKDASKSESEKQAKHDGGLSVMVQTLMQRLTALEERSGKTEDDLKSQLKSFFFINGQGI